VYCFGPCFPNALSEVHHRRVRLVCWCRPVVQHEMVHVRICTRDDKIQVLLSREGNDTVDQLINGAIDYSLPCGPLSHRICRTAIKETLMDLVDRPFCADAGLSRTYRWSVNYLHRGQSSQDGVKRGPWTAIVNRQFFGKKESNGMRAPYIFRDRWPINFPNVGCWRE
jgi:hypothetical protein